MLCKDNMANLDFKFKKNNAKLIFPSFSSFIFLFFYFLFLLLKRINKNNLAWNTWMLYNANAKKKENKNNKEEWS